jgi:hypothetical protein
MIPFESKALSAIMAPNLIPSIGGASPPRHNADPAEARNASDCPRHRSTPGFSSSTRPSICRWPGFESPFCALSVPVDMDNHAIDHRVFEVWGTGYGIEDAQWGSIFAHWASVRLKRIIQNLPFGSLNHASSPL